MTPARGQALPPSGLGRLDPGSRSGLGLRWSRAQTSESRFHTFSGQFPPAVQCRWDEGAPWRLCLIFPRARVGPWGPWRWMNPGPAFRADAVGPRIQDAPAQPPLPGHPAGEDGGDPGQPGVLAPGLPRAQEQPQARQDPGGQGAPPPRSLDPAPAPCPWGFRPGSPS